MPGRTYAVRFHPGSDLRKQIESFVKEQNIVAGWISTCVGSLSEYCLRFANQKEGKTGRGHFEIVSLGGTVSVNGCHLHICICDHQGSAIGGHLLEGCTIFTTAEVIVVTDDELIFDRETDNETGWKELKIQHRKNNS